MKEQQAVTRLQGALKENGIEARKLPRAAALRVIFMGSYHRVTHAGEGKGWLVNGYNEAGDPVKISELRSLCDELSGEAIRPVTEEAIGNPEPSDQENLASITTSSPVTEEAISNPEPSDQENLASITTSTPVTKEAIGNPEPSDQENLASITTSTPVTEEAIGNPEPSDQENLASITTSTPVTEEAIGNPEPSDQENLASITTSTPVADEAAPNPKPSQEKVLRQLQSAIAGIEGTTYCNKAPRQNGLLFDFQKEQYRVDFKNGDWVVGLVFGSGQHLGRLQELILSLLASGAIASEEPDTITGKAITLQQPWAWAITEMGKNVENRSWPTTHRGELYIHAGRGWDENGAAWIAQNFQVEVPPQSKMASGQLVAKCRVSDCKHWNETKGENLPWSQKFGFQWFLEDVEVLETPIPLRGKLGIFPFSVIDPSVMDPCDVDANAWCVANAPIADDEIDYLGVIPGTQTGSFTMLPTVEDEAAVRRRHLIKKIYDLARRTGVPIPAKDAEILSSPEECPIADLEKILNQLITLPPVSAGINWWRSHQDDDHGEPINYRPTAEVTR